jgi:hypothetical protein
MEAARTRFELRVATVVSQAALATFPVRLTPIAVPRNTVHRIVIPADSDLSEVLDRLTERHLVVLEIRRRSQTDSSDRGVAPGVREASADAGVPTATGRGVVVPFPTGRSGHCRRAGRSGDRPAD